MPRRRSETRPPPGFAKVELAKPLQIVTTCDVCGKESAWVRPKLCSRCYKALNPPQNRKEYMREYQKAYNARKKEGNSRANKNSSATGNSVRVLKAKS